MTSPEPPPRPAGDPFLPPVSAAGPVIVQIGELAITSSVVHTPAGDIPLRGSTWHVTDHWRFERRTPRWAVVTAVAGCCVLPVVSLLLLLVKRTIPRGTVHVTVSNGIRQYVARLPVVDEAQVTQVHGQVNYVRSLAAL